jgi:hypothetical protein
METPKECKAVPLEGVLSILAKSKRVAETLQARFGLEDGKEALEILRNGTLTGGLGNRVHDFLSDEIYNEAEEAWTGYIRSDESYPIMVSEYEGVFFVKPLESCAVGYFTKIDDAFSYIDANWWGEVKEEGENEDEEDNE